MNACYHVQRNVDELKQDLRWHEVRPGDGWLPRSTERGRIEAKPIIHVLLQVKGSLPRSTERGRIEAGDNLPLHRHAQRLPRSTERGRIEAERPAGSGRTDLEVTTFNGTWTN